MAVRSVGRWAATTAPCLVAKKAGLRVAKKAGLRVAQMASPLAAPLAASWADWKVRSMVVSSAEQWAVATVAT